MRSKNVIEALILGMYEDSRFMYREYIQNAVDRINTAVEEDVLNRKSDGKVNITIDKIKKTIIIEDNATGIKSNNLLQLLTGTTSQKGMLRKIGQLSGLGYCEKLIFETSYKGEAIKSIITLNAKQLKKIIEDRTVTVDAATVISVITSLDKTEAEIEDHFFKVELQNVTNEELLDEDSIKNYLSMVAPVPFSKRFPFLDKINTYFNEKNNIKIKEYNIYLNNNNKKLYKAYKSIQTILDIDFIKIKNEENELIALGWYGVSDLPISQNNIERGFRLRKNNIQIGSENTLSRYFNKNNHHHFIGEIHVLSNSFILNARRNYFNETKTVKTFEIKLKLILDTILE